MKYKVLTFDPEGLLLAKVVSTVHHVTSVMDALSSQGMSAE